jgi:hypothetical protein
MAPGVTCTQCGGTDIELDAARGDAVCIQCGAVLEENTIVNEVTFAQDAGGGSSVVGQFVSATPGLRSAGLGFAKESREVAFSNGQRHISQLAAVLRLSEHHQEAAQRLFMLAVQAREACLLARPPAGAGPVPPVAPHRAQPTRHHATDCPARQRLSHDHGTLRHLIWTAGPTRDGRGTSRRAHC